MDSGTIAYLGTLISLAGDWERGCALVDRAIQLNPKHPGWYWFPAFYNAYRKSDYRGALNVAVKINMPRFYATHLVTAAAYGQLGERDEASKALRELLVLWPDFGVSAREEMGKWFEPDLAEHLLDGLRKAGLKIPPQKGEAAAALESSKSVAVLPFVNMSADKHDEYLSDGMTEELINALARIPGLRVPGRTSCFAFKGKNEDDIFRKVGEQLHVNTVLEGSVRKAGDKLRVAAQLINVSDGYHLWSENYDGDVRDIFTFQSNVAQRVVEALQIKLGVEAALALAKKSTENPEAHRLYLLGRYHFYKFTGVGWTNAIHYFEHALQLDPNFALAYCGLADTYGWEGGQLMPGREAGAKEMELAHKALELDPKLAEAHLSMGTALFSVLRP